MPLIRSTIHVDRVILQRDLHRMTLRFHHYTLLALRVFASLNTAHLRDIAQTKRPVACIAFIDNGNRVTHAYRF